MKFRHCLLTLLITTGCVFASEPTPATPSPPETKAPSKFVFSLMPKSLQRKPSLDFHVITELTPEGKKIAPPTPEHPVYYLEQAGKFIQLGSNIVANEHAPKAAELERPMQRALAANNYLAATPSTPLPHLVVVFNYGSFERFSTDADDFQQMVAVQQLYQNADPSTAPAPFIPSGGDRTASSLLPLVLANRTERIDVLERAELIGGEKFAHELAAVLDKEAVYEQSSPGLGVSPADDTNSPFNRFVETNDNLMNLVEESFSSCYYVIASAYDYAAMTKGKKVLLWRTKMTVNSIGVSMPESLSTLIASAGPYFGRDMTEAATISRRISREGKVEIGTPTVVDDSAPTPPPPTPPAKAPSPAKP